MAKDSLFNIYRFHHKSGNKKGFSLLEKQRGKIISELVGSGKDILDIGCRDGTLTKHFFEDNRIIGVDIDYELLYEAQQKLGIEVIKMDLNESWSELGERKFDVVVAGEVLEHLYYPEEVVKKIKLRLRTGGKLIGSVPNAFHLKNRARYLWGSKKHTPLADPTHINHFSASELSLLLGRHFTHVEILGLGRHTLLANWKPSWFAYDLMFVCEWKK